MAATRPVFALILASALAATRLAPWSAAAEPGPAAAQAAPSPAVAAALAWAFKWASAIPVIPHGEERGKCQYQALKACLDLGLEDEAIRQADEIRNWQRGLLYTDLAAAYARREGPGQMMRYYLDRARSCRDCLDPEAFNVGWHRDRITAHMALALARAGLFEEADATAAGVQDPDLPLIVVEKLGRIDDDADYEQTVKALEAMGSGPTFETQEAAVLTWCRILENQGRTLAPTRLAEVLARVQGILPKLPMARHCVVRCAVARALLGCDQRDQGLKMLVDAVAELEQGCLNPLFDVANLAEVAQAYDQAAALPAKASDALQQAAALLKQGRGQGLDRGGLHAASVALAVGYAVHGDPDAAWLYLGQALGLATGQVNGRPRHMMLTDLCLAIGRCGYRLPADVSQALDEQWNRRGEPW